MLRPRIIPVLLLKGNVLVKTIGFKNPKYAPCPLLVNMVTAGKKGIKSGEGFYSWTHGTKDLIISPNFIK